MSEKTFKILTGACVFAFCLLVGKCTHHCITNPVRDSVRDTVRAVYVDTVRIVQPVAWDSVVLRYVKVRVPRVNGVYDTLFGVDNKEDKGNFARDVNKESKNTDSAEVELPITQKRYSDSVYTAWVSGFRPSLDSIHVHPRREVVTVTQTLRGKPKRWGVGIHAGYGMTPRGLQPYIGVGLNYNILDF